MRSRSTSVRQISVSSDPDRTLFLKLEWVEDLGSGFLVLLSDGVSAWSGEVSEEDVSREAQELEMERERYVSDLLLALTAAGPAEGEHRFHLTPERPGRPLRQLSYEKVQSDISFRLGAVELQAVPEPTEVIRELISHSLEQSTRLQARNQHLLEENQKLRKEQEHISKEMERYVQGKELLERDLYSRFVLVLNEKKAKLRALQERVKELEESIEENGLRKKKADSEDHEAMETAADKSPGEDTDYGGSTEDEEEAEPKRYDPKPHAQEMPESSPMDDSLNDITDVAPCRKRRHRHLQQLETEAKRAALDQRQRSREKPMEEAKAGTSKTSNVQLKPTSAAANLDPDDLFDDI